jgi:hypothetical protein
MLPDFSAAWARARMRQESNLQGAKARRVSNPVPSPVGLRIHERRERESDSQGTFQCSSDFESDAVANRLASPWRRTESSNLSACAPIRLPSGAGTLTGSSSMAESGELESHAARRALVSSEARPLAGSLSLRAPGGSRTLTSEDTGSWDQRGCQLRHQRIGQALSRLQRSGACLTLVHAMHAPERTTGFGPATLTLAR